MTNINKVLITATLILMLATNVMAATPKVILTFDDGWTSQYYKAFPIMQANHQNGTAFIKTGVVSGASGQPGMEYMNLSQLKALYNAGWDLSSHTVTHSDLTTLTPTALNSELSTSKNWLNNSGFTKASGFLAYPYGAYNATVISAVQANGYLAARTVNFNHSYPQFTLSSPSIYELPALTVQGVPGYGNPAMPPAYIKNEINNTIASNGLLIITFHIIEDVCCVAGANAPEEYKTSDFKIISDFLKSKVDVGQLDVVTMSEYFGTSIPAPIPAPTFNISGFKLNSSDNKGLPGWNIRLLNITTGLELANKTTDSTGFYNFTGLANGTYNVTEVMKQGWMNVTPMSLIVTITGTDATNKNFTNALIPPAPAPIPAPTFNISGFKINNATKIGISGWNITLANSTMQMSMLTLTDGSYKFTDLVNGTYNVTEVMKQGWMNVTPMSLIVTITGTDATNKNFTNALIPPAPALKGDLNNDGKPAGAVDVNMMLQASVGDITPDQRFDLNGDGKPAGAVDVNMMLQASVGDIKLDGGS